MLNLTNPTGLLAFTLLMSSFLVGMEQTLPWHRELFISEKLLKPVLEGHFVFICDSTNHVFVLDTDRIHRQKTTEKIRTFSFSDSDEPEMKGIGDGVSLIKNRNNWMFIYDHRLNKLMVLKRDANFPAQAKLKMMDESVNGYRLSFCEDHQNTTIHLHKGHRLKASAILRSKEMASEGFLLDEKVCCVWDKYLLIGSGGNISFSQIWPNSYPPIILSNKLLLISSPEKAKLGVYDLAAESMIAVFSLNGRPLPPVADDKFIYMALEKKEYSTLTIFKIEDFIALGSMADG